MQVRLRVHPETLKTDRLEAGPTRVLGCTLSMLLTAAAVGLAACSAHGEPDPGSLAQVDVLQRTLAAVADEVRPSVVSIRADRRPDDRGDASSPAMPDDQVHQPFRDRVIPAVGSGVIISEDGLILTNEHVIHGADLDAIECVLSNDQRYAVQGVTTDPRSDLAVLRIDARNLRPAPLGDADTVRQGHFAIVMGNPFGSASQGQGRPAMSFGIVSGLGRDLTRKLGRDRYYGNLLQTDARINPGNSGGPLLNIQGEVIGIITAISSRSGGSEGVGYAITVDERTKRIITQLGRGEEVEYGYLGIGLREATDRDRKRAGGPQRGGALIETVHPGTPAADARLRSGDVIAAFDCEPVESVDKLIRLVGAARVGVAVEVTVHRNKRKMTVMVTLARRKNGAQGINLEVPFRYRGMTLENPTAKVRDRFKLPEQMIGAVVTAVDSDGAAAKAGIEAGQVIVRVSGEAVKGVRRVRRMAADLEGPVRLVIDAEPPLEVTLP